MSLTNLSFYKPLKQNGKRSAMDNIYIIIQYGSLNIP